MHSLDGLRAISILIVIFFHAFLFSKDMVLPADGLQQLSESLPVWLGWIRRGDLGVDVFFVLSAFLIGSQLFYEKEKTEQINFRYFYLKRLFRIYPLYLTLLAIYMMAKGGDIYLLANIFAFNNFTGYDNVIIPWSWSISVEVQFYLLAPFVIVFFTRQKTLLILLAGVLVPLLWMFYFYLNSALPQETLLDIIQQKNKVLQTYYMDMLYVLPIVRLPDFVFGLMAAWYWVHKKEALENWVSSRRQQVNILIWLALLSSFLIASLDIYLPSDQLTGWHSIVYDFNMVAGRTVFAFLVTFILLMTVLRIHQRHIVTRILSSKLLYPVAKVSYSMYLFHPLFLGLAFYAIYGKGKIELLSISGLLGIAILGALFSFIFGCLTYVLIERWFISPRFKQRLKGWL